MDSGEILQTLGNKYSAEILDATDEPVSARSSATNSESPSRRGTDGSTN